MEYLVRFTIFLLFSNVLCEEDIGLTEGDVEIEGISRNKDDVKFYYYLNENTTREINIGENLQNLPLKQPADIYIVVDGFLSNYTSSMSQTTKNALLKNGKHVVVVDWGKMNGNLAHWDDILELGTIYRKAAVNVGNVGKRVAHMIKYMKEEFKNTSTPISLIFIVSHCLGSHIAGAAGSWTKLYHLPNIEKITALDPAGPLFSYQPDANKRLTKRDAVQVEIFASNRGVLGDYAEDKAHQYYILNDGVKQPGCESADNSKIEGFMCSHSYSWKYWSKCLEVLVEKIAGNTTSEKWGDITKLCRACPCPDMKHCICNSTCPTCGESEAMFVDGTTYASNQTDDVKYFNVYDGPLV